MKQGKILKAGTDAKAQRDAFYCLAAPLDCLDCFFFFLNPVSPVQGMTLPIIVCALPIDPFPKPT